MLTITWKYIHTTSSVEIDHMIDITKQTYSKGNGHNEQKVFTARHGTYAN